jgi:hypothetical protein
MISCSATFSPWKHQSLVNRIACPKYNITINISVPIWQVNIFSEFSIISLPALHNPSIQIFYSNLKYPTYFTNDSFLVQGCWTVLVPSLDEIYLSILLIDVPIDALATTPTV